MSYPADRQTDRYMHKAVRGWGNYCIITLHYIKKIKGGLSKNFEDHRAQQATQATIQCLDKIAETNESSVFVGTPVKTAQM